MLLMKFWSKIMCSDEFIKRELVYLNRYIREYLADIPYNTHHLDHIERVKKICLQIGGKLKADLTVLEVAALFHDYSRIDERDGSCHAELSADFMSQFLTDRNWDKEIKDNICYAIRCHRYSSGIIPETLEAKILQDSDRLDVLGAIGIVRVMMHTPQTTLYNLNMPFPENRTVSKEYVLDHFYEKILKLKDGFHTKEAQKIANVRHDYLLTFLEQLKSEII